jgi:hypothetical protein
VIQRHLMITTGVLLFAALLMGGYLWHIQRRAHIAAPANDTRTVPPPATGPTEQAMLYVADDATSSIQAQAYRIPLPAGRQQRALALLRALTAIYLDKNSPHPIGTGSEVRDAYLVDPGVAVIDVNQAFAATHRSGIMVEELTVASFVQTLAANLPGILRVKILVEGTERDTLAGHADLTNFYDVSAVNQLVTQLQVAPQPPEASNR